MIELLWQYILIFIMAATPWLEILIVIPIGIGMGLHPIMVGIVSYIGNFLPIILIVYTLSFIKRTRIYQQWQQKRHNKKQLKMQMEEHSVKKQEENRVKEEKRARRQQRAKTIFYSYGLPGLAFLGPLVTGIHLATIIALTLKASKRHTTVWMGVGLGVWTIGITVASYYSIDWIVNIVS
ncbi:small multi-drug export protein [Salipaludibacillus agaradhaerens]|uniref:Small multi-drug export protein n=1 Tax=Salipaludibacillus agaradhaerens TaxID=76935 RepID=A0A9Q4G005_SALAG|nr:small multi-drug export protein [Salipaludibacillus agaradhaerens]MCR6097368.1 small multi-drug export protein [Salipaludibacillus agaradhaerens]MCR6105824.1 small multi-drug export protein [Salipaludibacillus agaradhaerens]MCR6113147.1 small multi-drug export protein [Salipaludibacillus agaradhaerens]MCR6117859.1 small multi-drug export protein [Salipaludibacillus agaradhaerens]